MKIAYLGLDFLRSALDAALREGCEVLKIFTCPADNVTEFNLAVRETARREAIPLSMERLRARDLAQLRQAGCELLLCAGYYYRVPVTDAFPMVNFHPSPLPVGRGAWPMPWILLKGLPQGGVTAHKMTREWDAGDILLQETFAIRPGETLASYMEQVNARIPAMVRALARDAKSLWANARPQGAGEYWPMPTESDWTVTPQMDVAQADRVLRAFYGYECVYRTERGHTELIGGRAVPGDSAWRPFLVRGGYIRAERSREL